MQANPRTIDTSMAPCWCLATFECKSLDSVQYIFDPSEEDIVDAVIESISQRWHKLNKSIVEAKKSDKMQILQPVYSKTSSSKVLVTYLINSETTHSPKMSPFVCPHTREANSVIVSAQLDSEMLRFSELVTQQRLPWQACSCPRAIENMFIKRIKYVKYNLESYVRDGGSASQAHLLQCVNEAKLRLNVSCDGIFELVTDYESNIDLAMKKWSRESELVMRDNRTSRNDSILTVFLTEESNLMKQFEHDLINSDKAVDFGDSMNHVMLCLDELTKKDESLFSAYMLKLTHLRRKYDSYRYLTSSADYWQLVSSANIELERLSKNFAERLQLIHDKKEFFIDSSESFLLSNVTKISTLCDQVKGRVDSFFRHTETIIHAYGLHVDEQIKTRMKLDGTDQSRRDLSWSRHCCRFQADQLTKMLKDFRIGIINKETGIVTEANRLINKFKIKQKRSLDWALYSNEQRLRSKFEDAKHTTITELNRWKAVNSNHDASCIESEVSRRLGIDKQMENLFDVTCELLRQSKRIMSRLSLSVTSFNESHVVESTNMITNIEQENEECKIKFNDATVKVGNIFVAKAEEYLSVVNNKRDSNAQSLATCLRAIEVVIERQASASSASLSRSIIKASAPNPRVSSAGLRRPESAARQRQSTVMTGVVSPTVVADLLDVDLSTLIELETQELAIIFENSLEELNLKWIDDLNASVVDFSQACLDKNKSEFASLLALFTDLIRRKQDEALDWECSLKRTIETVYDNSLSSIAEVRVMFPYCFDINGMMIDLTYLTNRLAELLVRTTLFQCESMYSAGDESCKRTEEKIKSIDHFDVEADDSSFITNFCNDRRDKILKDICNSSKGSLQMYASLESESMLSSESLVCFQLQRKRQIQRYSQWSSNFTLLVSSMVGSYQKCQENDLQMIHDYRGLTRLDDDSKVVLSFVQSLKTANSIEDVQEIVSKSNTAMKAQSLMYWNSVNGSIASYVKEEEEGTHYDDLAKARLEDMEYRLGGLAQALTQFGDYERSNYTKHVQRFFDAVVEEEIMIWEATADQRLVRHSLIELVNAISSE